MILVNGLGSFRHFSFFRFFILGLFLLNKHKIIVFQNYADYRWARRFLRSDVAWVPGSGGRARLINLSSQSFTIVTRPTKLGMVKTSLLKFVGSVPIDTRFNLIGISPADLIGSGIVDNRFCALGYKEQSKVISFGGTLFVPDGYGEGIPHVMVDALVSGLPVVLTKKSYTKYGLSKLSIKAKKFHSEWVVIDPCPDVAKESLGVEVISERYFSLLSSVS